MSTCTVKRGPRCERMKRGVPMGVPRTVMPNSSQSSRLSAALRVSLFLLSLREIPKGRWHVGPRAELVDAFGPHLQRRELCICTLSRSTHAHALRHAHASPTHANMPLLSHTHMHAHAHAHATCTLTCTCTCTRSRSTHATCTRFTYTHAKRAPPLAHTPHPRPHRPITSHAETV